MSKRPILVLQMQRMGDLVLTFPLLGRLLSMYPGHPLWVVGEEAFFKPLMPLSPAVTYFGYEAAPGLKTHAFELAINLSHRPEAAALAGELRADALFGAYMDGNALRARGDWQIYRLSLTHNNRHNLYHWADLNCLDAVPARLLPKADWPLPRPLPQGKNARIGLFLGASEAQKHPDAAFWTELCRRLLHAGHKPALLGGKAEQKLGRAVSAALKAPALDLCGHFSVRELAAFLRELDFFICPDTGPMHVAVWLGTPTLNLSLGPVNAWETGPVCPGHHALRAALDCAGCWRCTQPRHFCREAMSAASTAALILSLLSPRTPEDEGAAGALSGLELLTSARDAHGLYDLDGAAEGAAEARMALSRFWQAWFGAVFGLLPEEAARAARQKLAPETAGALSAAAAAFAARTARSFRGGPAAGPPDEAFWRAAPDLIHPFSGYAQMYLQNEYGSRPALARILELAERLAAGA